MDKQWGCEDTITGDDQSPIRSGPEQPVVGDAALSKSLDYILSAGPS